MNELPQEIEVRYIIPAIRGSLARSLVEDGFSQKKAAILLGLTEGAISQYLNGKRGAEVLFSQEVSTEIGESATKIREEEGNKQRVAAEITRILQLPEVRHTLCELHQKQSKELEGCTICFDEQLIPINNIR